MVRLFVVYRSTLSTARNYFNVQEELKRFGYVFSKAALWKSSSYFRRRQIQERNLTFRMVAVFHSFSLCLSRNGKGDDCYCTG